MKRLTALLLAVVLALCTLPALAADYPIEEKFYRQMVESAFLGTVTFSTSGTQTTAMDAASWFRIRSLLPRVTLEADHSLTRGEGQATMRLLLDDQSAGETKLLYNDTLMGLSSDLLAGTDTYYTAARDWDVSQLAQAMIQGSSVWPPLWRVLLAVLTAPEEWQLRAQPFLEPYETKLGVWMNGYASFATGVQDNVGYTQLQCAIPAQAIKAEIKQLLVDFYANGELLSLLREIVTPQEAAAYLQSGMQDTFFSTLDALALEGTVEITRRYDAQGNLLLDSITLPFADTQTLRTLTLAVSPSAEGQHWAFSGQAQDGTDFDISFVAGENMAYTGSVRLLLPEAADGSSFIVSDTAARRTIAFDYNFSWDPGEETYTLATSRFERTLRGTLVIKPQEGWDMPDQSLILEASFSSGSSQRSATQLNATLTWQDLDGDASITATLAGRTAAPFAVDSLSAVTGAMRLDLMTDESHSALIARWGQTASAWLENLAARLVPALSTVTP